MLISADIDLKEKITKEQFLELSAKNACLYAYSQYKGGRWSLKNFDDSLRAWWKNRHGDKQRSLLDDTESRIVEKDLADTIDILETNPI